MKPPLDELLPAIRSALSSDLLSREQRAMIAPGDHPTKGHCAIATEAAYHLLGGRDSGWIPVVLPKKILGYTTHWWLRNSETLAIFDPTAEQFPGGRPLRIRPRLRLPGPPRHPEQAGRDRDCPRPGVSPEMEVLMPDSATTCIVDDKFGLGLRMLGPIEQHFVEGAISRFHYLGKYPDPRCMTFAYSVTLHDEWIGCLTFGRPQAGRLFKGPLTYGSIEDIKNGRAEYCRWEILNLSRVWFSPSVRRGETSQIGVLPGFVDRKGEWRSSLASTAIREAIKRIRVDYLLMYPPVFFRKYNIRVVLSYCDTRLHKGTIYRSAGFSLASCNRDKIETYMFDQIAPLYDDEDIRIRHAGKTPSTQHQETKCSRSYASPNFFS